MVASWAWLYTTAITATLHTKNKPAGGAMGQGLCPMCKRQDVAWQDVPIHTTRGELVWEARGSFPQLCRRSPACKHQGLTVESNKIQVDILYLSA